MLLIQIMHNYLMWLLRSLLARAPYVVVFDLKSLIKDGNLHVYMYCVHAWKRASGAPDPLTQSILWGPTFCICPGPPNPLSGPDYVHGLVDEQMNLPMPYWQNMLVQLQKLYGRQNRTGHCYAILPDSTASYGKRTQTFENHGNLLTYLADPENMASMH